MKTRFEKCDSNATHISIGLIFKFEFYFCVAVVILPRDECCLTWRAM